MEIIRNFLSAAPNELIFTLFGALLLFLIEQAYSWGKDKISYHKIKKELREYQSRIKIVNVIDLINGVPDIKKKDILFSESSIFGNTKR